MRRKYSSYKWKEGFLNKGVPAAKANKEIERIKRKKGLSAEAIVQEAKDKNNILHPLFEWDDAKAADKYRLTQAQNITRALVAVDEETGVETRLYFPTIFRSPKEARSVTMYDSIENILADPDARGNLLKRALAELESFKRKYSNLEELSDVMQAIDSLVEVTV